MVDQNYIEEIKRRNAERAAKLKESLKIGDFSKLAPSGTGDEPPGAVVITPGAARRTAGPPPPPAGNRAERATPPAKPAAAGPAVAPPPPPPPPARRPSRFRSPFAARSPGRETGSSPRSGKRAHRPLRGHLGRDSRRDRVGRAR